MEMNVDLLALIEQNLPPLPDTVARLCDYLNQDSSKIEVSGIVDIISKDPMITANLLKTANAPYYGFLSEITTINQAVTLLGVENVKNLVMANSLHSMFKVNVSPYGLDTDKFLVSCAREVDFISDWLNAEDKRLTQTLIPCAMLFRLGMILFSTVLIRTKKDKQFQEEIKKNNYQNIALVEQAFFGVDHISFLAYCFDYWRFDETLTQMIVYATSPHSAPKSIKKGAYALAITNRIFEPYEGGNDYNINEAVLLLKEALDQDINFNLDNLLKHLPALPKNDTDE